MENIMGRRLGRGLMLLAATILLLDGFLQIASPPPLVEALVHIGFPPDAGPRIAILTIACALLLAFPSTSFLGALLTTGFLGGAICSHVRVGEIGSPPQLICVALGLAVWGGLALADPRVRALLFSAPQTRDSAPLRPFEGNVHR